MPDRTAKFHKVVERLSGRKLPQQTPLKSEKRIFSPFLESAAKLHKEIYILRKYIIDTRKDYVDPYNHFSSAFKSPMSDRERDIIENNVQKSFKQLVRNLDALKELIIHGKEAPDSVESRKGVLLILFQRMEALSSYFQTQRSKRVQQEHLITEGWLVMEPGDFIELSETEIVDRTSKNRQKKPGNTKRRAENKAETEDLPVEPSVQFNIPVEPEEDLLVPKDEKYVEQLQKENRELLNELESKVDQVRIVEKQVVEISTLQETFSTKVEEQAEEIESLHQLAVESTASVSHAKVILSEAANDGINFRLFLIVALATMPIALLFVHAYN